VCATTSSFKGMGVAVLLFDLDVTKRMPLITIQIIEKLKFIFLKWIIFQ
jgi:hypothetical protein